MVASPITQDEFDAILLELLFGMSASALLAIDGIYEIVSEELNNEVLATWEGRNYEQDSLE